MEKHAHESGLLGIVDVCAGCQRRGLQCGEGKRVTIGSWKNPCAEGRTRRQERGAVWRQMGVKISQ